MILFVVTGILVLIATGKWAFDEGAKPMRRLKAGTYRVEAVIYVNNTEVMLVVSRHVDWGHYEFRLARLPNQWFCPGVPKEGDQIRVSREAPDAYYVHPEPPFPPTVPCIG